MERIWQNKNLRLYVLYIISVLPLYIFRDFIPANELRYLSIVDEALRNHNFFIFSNHSVPYADKPPLYFWCLMICRWIAGRHFLFLYGLFSIIPAIITVAIFNRWTKNLISDDFKISSQLFLLTTGLFLALSIYLRMDMMMCMFIVLSLYEFWKIYNYKGNITKHQLLLGIYTFLAIFSKGPYGIVIPLISTFCFLLKCREIRRFFLIWNRKVWIIIFLGLTLWILAIYIEGGMGYINNLFIHQTVGRAVKSFHHSEPFYYYFICTWYCLAPWSIIILGLIISAVKNKINLDKLQYFFLCIIISTFLTLSCVSSKIEIYMLPIIPFIIYEGLIYLNNNEIDTTVIYSFKITSLLFCLVLPVFLVFRLINNVDFLDSIWIWLTASAFSFSGVLALRSLKSTRGIKTFKKCINILCYGFLVGIFFLGFAMPGINKFIGYKELSKKIELKSKATGINLIKSWHIGRPENMDVYNKVKIIDILDEHYFPTHLKDSINEPYILVTRIKKIKELGGLEVDTVGKYCITIVGR